ncbi:dTDP-4-dehydrorhamnose reductase [Paucibacter sp. DJ2R-2]|uniref:dTDP-4-dehydrorhamnose reductase n=1 Tax=Paucibacter sp. DJ2R-2 TaxID=2893558 RepID=UPI0021E3E53E|nr:dTDP-4-dehydrorhamnose reductase [Paucibacter sp. DJ2R-2]MCV2422804.1 dTDP-4-dehydrorhamnose reductase [Paucibacter sp. DJ4R-1]MCV2441055.1 dTDP-4-dehydrorhamnose reductase [Paucibacter sp. DJ2R-2]
MTRILLLGKNGQVGWELQRALSPLGELIALDRHDGGDLTDSAALSATVRRIAPQLIVNAAAYTAVDKAESDSSTAQQINATAPGLLADEAARLGALLVHYSTDYVFDGSGDQARDEAAATAPLSVYGASKLAGEEAIRASGCQHLILRTSWVYAARGANFAKTMLRLAAEREQLSVISDQIGAPTGADLLADLCAHMARATLRDPSLAGTYHAVAAGATSWYAYACHVIEFARARGTALRVAPDQVQAIPTEAYPTPARRPLNSRLATDKLQQAFGLRLPHWQQGVERMLAEIL